jgi:CRISPR-associated protein Cas5d
VSRGKSEAFRVRVTGELACFTRPEMKVERVSYEVMTPSAARGILQAILWKPQISWHIQAIHVLAPIRWASFRRNEVQKVAPKGAKASDVIVVDDERTQRNTVALRDVDYVIEAWFERTPLAKEDDTVAKYVAMFQRRLEKGQWYHPPSLGCREFAANVCPAPEGLRPAEIVDRPLGWMFYDFDWANYGGGEAPAGVPVKPLFFEARLTGGVLLVPPRETVRKALEVQP